MLEMLLIDNPVVTNCLIDQVCCCFSLGSHKFLAGLTLLCKVDIALSNSENSWDFLISITLQD